jgi:AcrR family transcriptional regulator
VETESRTATRLDRRSRTARAEGRNGRDDLLRAAGEVFAEKGFNEASVDEIAERAGYSKGALYWHFATKEDVFFALLDERIDAPTRKSIELLESAPPEHDMAPEASKRLVELLRTDRELYLLDQEYWSQAVRDPDIRARYAERGAEMRAALARAIEARAEHLGAPPFDVPFEDIATAIMSLAGGLARQRLVEPDSVPDHLLGETIALIYRGLVARALGVADPGAG